MGDCLARDGWVGIQWIWVIAQRGEANAVPLAKRIDIIRAGPRQTGDVNVADPGELALGLAGGPARDLQAGEAILRGKCERLFKRKVRQNGGKESKFHKFNYFSAAEAAARILAKKPVLCQIFFERPLFAGNKIIPGDSYPPGARKTNT